MNGPSQPRPLLSVRELRKWYKAGRAGHVRAVDGVSLDIMEGETLGLVGESGCGKSTLGRVVLALEPPTSGSVRFEDRDLSKLGRAELHELRRRMQVVFQDPNDSLDPRMTVGAIVAEPLVVHRVGGRASREERVRELLEAVGLSASYARRYPHEFSGGQRQRIAIARSLALRPSFIVCDEPVSALDVSIQSQIVNLLSDLRQSFNLTYLFIAHNLAVVRHISNRVGVMYLGKLVELGDKKTLFARHLHPYTEALIAAAPVPDPSLNQEIAGLQGDVPSPLDPPSGCVFHPRCPRAELACSSEEPQLREVEPGYWVACRLVSQAPASDGPKEAS